MYYLYILYSSGCKKTYVGQTSDIRKRINEHNKGKVKSTKKSRPYKLLYKEELDTREEALAREKFFKSFRGRKKIKEILLNAEMAELVDALDSKSSEDQTS